LLTLIVDAQPSIKSPEPANLLLRTALLALVDAESRN
jgi:hypothetical protein